MEEFRIFVERTEVYRGYIFVKAKDEHAATELAKEQVRNGTADVGFDHDNTWYNIDGDVID